MATARLAQFVADIGRARDLVALGQALGAMTQGRVDSSDVYRAGLVHGVAALDAYVHGVVLDRGVDMILGRIQVTGSESKIGLNFGAVQSLMNAPSPAQAELHAKTYVAERLSKETFQRADAIGQALAMVGVPKIWTQAFQPNPSTVMTALGVIVGRRNRIVHECDYDPLNPGSVVPLTDADALDAVSTIEQIGVKIDSFC